MHTKLRNIQAKHRSKDRNKALGLRLLFHLTSFIIDSSMYVILINGGLSTGAALLKNNEASAKLTTANSVTFTSSSARLSSQARYRSLDQ